VSERRSCLALGVDRSSVRYVSRKPDQAPLRLRIHDLAAARVRYGYFRIYILLRREGWLVNHKRVYRLYREDGLSLRLRRPRRNVSAANRERQPAASAPNEMWSMDFVSDALFDGRRLRALTVVDSFTREALAIDVDQGIKGEQVVAAMARIASVRGAPKTIRVVGRSSSRRRSTAGRTRTASRSTFRGRGSRPTTPLSRASMVACATNA
jgi:putative transposase